MKVLLVSDFYPPVRGGLEFHVDGLASELVNRGHQVHVATLTADATASNPGVQVDCHSEWPEPFGQVAVEAMLAGAPLVVTRVGGLSSVVDEGVTGLVVEPRSPQALAAALSRVLHDADLRARLSAGSLAHAGKYTVSAACGQVEDAYTRAIAIRRSR